jgi:lipopolysaccharide export LptBFGC system permease protein LptF
MRPHHYEPALPVKLFFILVLILSLAYFFFGCTTTPIASEAKDAIREMEKYHKENREGFL